MNNQDFSPSVDDLSPASLPFGALLKAGREAAGVELPVLAATLKVPLKKLEALESGDLQQLPDMVFARALASSVCRHFGLNAADVLASLPQAAHPAFRTPERVDTYRTGTGMALSLSDTHGIRWGLVGAIVCLMLALAIGFWPESELAPAASVSSSVDAEKKMDVSGPSFPPVPAVGPPQSGAETVAGAVPAAASHVSAVADPVVASGAQMSSGAVSAVASPVFPLSGTSSSQSVQPLIPSPSTGDASLQFTASAASWIRVTDGNGAVIWEKTVMPGTVETVPGKAPLTVVIGRADVTRVLLYGKPYDLTSVIKDNVARFEVRK
jgi:cytoskeleton protein RodZ